MPRKSPIPLYRKQSIKRPLIISAALCALIGLMTVFATSLLRKSSPGEWSESHEVGQFVIGKEVLHIRLNTIRFEKQRKSLTPGRLDLALTWPDMAGYSSGRQTVFNPAPGVRANLLQLGIGTRQTPQDIDGRIAQAYRPLLGSDTKPGPGGLSITPFLQGNGYDGEVLAVSTEEPFSARCEYSDDIHQDICLRDIHVGASLSVLVRFPRRLLADWKLLDGKVRNFITGVLVTPAQ